VTRREIRFEELQRKEGGLRETHCRRRGKANRPRWNKRGLMARR